MPTEGLHGRWATYAGASGAAAEKPVDNSTIECIGFIIWRVAVNASWIYMLLQLAEITGTTENTIGDDELNRIALQ